MPAETGPIPTGTTCTVSEPDPPPGYELVDISPSQVVVTDGPDPVEVTVTNERLLGELTVTKVLDGDPAGAEHHLHRRTWTANRVTPTTPTSP